MLGYYIKECYFFYIPNIFSTSTANFCPNSIRKMLTLANSSSIPSITFSILTPFYNSFSINTFQSIYINYLHREWASRSTINCTSRELCIQANQNQIGLIPNNLIQGQVFIASLKLADAVIEESDSLSCWKGYKRSQAGAKRRTCRESHNYWYGLGNWIGCRTRIKNISEHGIGLYISFEPDASPVMEGRVSNSKQVLPSVYYKTLPQKAIDVGK